jgi:hypothetical protein
MATDGQILNRLCGTVAVALSLTLAGCSARPEAPAPPPAATSAPASVQPTTPGPAPETGPTGPAPDCLDGGYRVEEFRATGADGSTAAGAGGDLTMTFDAGAFVMASKGTDPATITIAGDTDELVLNGELTGSYERADGDQVRFTFGEGTGTAQLRDAKGVERAISVKQVARVLAPAGEATVTCGADELTLENEQLTLQLVR